MAETQPWTQMTDMDKKFSRFIVRTESKQADKAV